MQSRPFSFVAKVLVTSALLSYAIKIFGPQLNLSATPSSILTVVLMPSLLMGMALGLQYWRQHRK